MDLSATLVLGEIYMGPSAPEDGAQDDSQRKWLRQMGALRRCAA